MGLADWFSTFCGNLVVVDSGTISSRYCRITQRLNTDYWNTTSETAHSLYVGSYGRNTAIQGFSDLDMVFELPWSVYTRYNSHYGNGQSALLQAIRLSIEKTYPKTGLRGDGQVILVPFTDGLTFEVVPVFSNNDGSYIFPDANNGGCWRSTNPRPEIQAIRDRNSACNGNLIQLARMIRAWKRTWDVPIGGLLIDTLAYQFIHSWPHKDKSYFYYDFLARDFFKWASEQDYNQEYWRAPGSGQYVRGKGLFQYKAKRCFNISTEAIAHESRKEEWAAKYDWRQIFGTTFPD